MGFIRHNTIVVTSWNSELIKQAAAFARSLDLQVLGPSALAMNHYRTLCIPSDGSKEGWPESNEADARRAKFREWLRTQVHKDDSSSLEWFEAAYGDDDEEASILTSAWTEEP